MSLIINHYVSNITLKDLGEYVNDLITFLYISHYISVVLKRCINMLKPCLKSWNTDTQMSSTNILFSKTSLKKTLSDRACVALKSGADLYFPLEPAIRCPA